MLCNGVGSMAHYMSGMMLPKMWVPYGIYNLLSNEGIRATEVSMVTACQPRFVSHPCAWYPLGAAYGWRNKISINMDHREATYDMWTIRLLHNFILLRHIDHISMLWYLGTKYFTMSNYAQAKLFFRRSATIIINDLQVIQYFDNILFSVCRE